jgi:hypothetical protein
MSGNDRLVEEVSGGVIGLGIRSGNKSVGGGSGGNDTQVARGVGRKMHCLLWGC